MKNNLKEKKYLWPLLGIVLIVLIVQITTSFSFMLIENIQVETSFINSLQCTNFKLNADSTSFKLISEKTINEKDAEEYKSYSYELDNTCLNNSYIYTYIVISEETTIDISKIKIEYNNEIYSLEDLSIVNLNSEVLAKTETITGKTVKKSYLLNKELITPTKKVYDDIKIWIDNSLTGSENDLNLSLVLSDGVR